MAFLKLRIVSHSLGVHQIEIKIVYTAALQL